jgi:SNF2 family DNA or RNA helicase
VASLKRAVLEATSKTGSNDKRLGSGLKQYGESFRHASEEIVHGQRNATYRFLRQLLEIASGLGLNEHEAFKHIEGVVQSHYFYDPVVQIEEGQAPLMDIEVGHSEHCFSGNGIINHNTIEALAALCYLWEREPNNRVIVVSPKSAVRQWASETARFTTGIKVFIVAGKPEPERKAVWEAWAKYTGPDKPMLIVNYHPLVKDWDSGARMLKDEKGNPDPKQVVPGWLDALTKSLTDTVVIFDEATAFKTPGIKTWQTCAFLSHRVHRCYGLTATLLKNTLIEGFGIYKVIKPDVFTTKTAFMRDYCITTLQRVSGGRKIPVIVGYKNLDGFRERIDPHFLGRQKHQVSDELPTLITKERVCELSPAEVAKYKEALSGVLQLGDGEVRDFEEHKAFVSLCYCQQVVNSLSMLRYKEGAEVVTGLMLDEIHKVDNLGSKETLLMDLLSDELDGEKTIVYTRFASLVPRLQTILAENKIKSVCITGEQNDKQRSKAQAAFQDTESDTKVIFITDAGSEAINLQAASAMVFFDAPWSWGNYVQLLGRPIRIGSPHQHVVVYHLVAERPGTTKKERTTIDRYVLEILDEKKTLIDKVIGEAAVGALEFDTASSTKALVRKLQGKS